MAIVRKKARLRCIDLPESVVHLVASRVVSNTRELEGTITKLDLLSQQHGGVIDDALVAQALNEPAQAAPPNIAIAHITDVVASHYGVKVSDLQGKRRTKSITLPRQVCMYLARQLTTLSLEEIGGCFGGRDHTTVLHARQKVAAGARKHKPFQEELEALANRIRRGV